MGVKNFTCEKGVKKL